MKLNSTPILYSDKLRDMYGVWCFIRRFIRVKKGVRKTTPSRTPYESLSTITAWKTRLRDIKNDPAVVVTVRF